LNVVKLLLKAGIKPTELALIWASDLETVKLLKEWK